VFPPRHLLQKPFTREILLRKLNKTLELQTSAAEEWQFVDVDFAGRLLRQQGLDELAKLDKLGK
jgi:hypothetical protein